MFQGNRYRDESIMSTALKLGIGAVAVYAGASIVSSLLRDNARDNSRENSLEKEVQEAMLKHRSMCFNDVDTDEYVVNDNTPLEEPIACSIH
jgi:hypothetical protein